MLTLSPAHVPIAAQNSTTTGGPPITLILLMVAVIAIVMAASMAATGVRVYRELLGAFTTMFAGAVRLGIAIGLLGLLLALAIGLAGETRNQQAPGPGQVTGTTGP